jgi:4-alpha-glucanotransferase
LHEGFLMQSENILNDRRAGILLHVTSLPGADDHGDFGNEAYNFITFLADTGISLWQTLPLGMPHADGSPYQCLSAHAGDSGLISLDWLLEKGWLEDAEPSNGQVTTAYRNTCIEKALHGFEEKANAKELRDFTKFCQQKAWWLDDFALFVVLRNEFSQLCWADWPEQFRNRDKKTLKNAQRRLAKKIAYIKFGQYVFLRQWQEIRSYAHQKGVVLFGDIPIFVAYDSADVWAQRENFKLDENGNMTVVAGVPPDYFSVTGQRWGNPHYNWKQLRGNKYQWWVERFQSQFELFDIIRIDHFRGLEAAWEIPADQETAVNGKWVKAPGRALLNRIKKELGDVPLVAEDLGVITPEVEALRDYFHLPGMKILQFAFDGGTENPYLPYNYPKNCVVYTGTHDNDTTLGWYESLSDEQKYYVHESLGCSKLNMPHALIHAALASVANIAIIPMQDLLELGSEHRMNTPGTITPPEAKHGNWRWRFEWSQVSEEKARLLAHLVGLFGRKVNSDS